MPFYPTTLKTRWYMEGVCDSIHASLEGTKLWTSRWYENSVEREAYIRAFTRCQSIVRHHDLYPDKMLQALDEYHDDVVTRETLRPRWYTLTRWIRDPAEAEEQAVRVAFSIVDSIAKRFL